MTPPPAAGPPLSPAQLRRQLGALGLVPGELLLLHAGLRALGPVEGGAAALLGALLELLGPSGTLAMPSWGDDDDAVFDPARTPAAADLGVTAEVFRGLPGVVRSDHPFAFAARGPLAGALLRDPLPLPPHGAASPVGRLRELGGRILLLGVGHDANTTLHLAEALAAVPYGVTKHCTVRRDAEAVRVHYRETDHCCAGFALADGWLRAGNQQREGRVGRAEARLMSARTLVAAALPRLRREPLLFLHAPEAGCADCDAARAGIA